MIVIPPLPFVKYSLGSYKQRRVVAVDNPTYNEIKNALENIDDLPETQVIIYRPDFVNVIREIAMNYVESRDFEGLVSFINEVLNDVETVQGLRYLFESDDIRDVFGYLLGSYTFSTEGITELDLQIFDVIHRHFPRISIIMQSYDPELAEAYAEYRQVERSEVAREIFRDEYTADKLLESVAGFTFVETLGYHEMIAFLKSLGNAWVFYDKEKQRNLVEALQKAVLKIDDFEELLAVLDSGAATILTDLSEEIDRGFFGELQGKLYTLMTKLNIKSLEDFLALGRRVGNSLYADVDPFLYQLQRLFRHYSDIFYKDHSLLDLYYKFYEIDEETGRNILSPIRCALPLDELLKKYRNELQAPAYEHDGSMDINKMVEEVEERNDDIYPTDTKGADRVLAALNALLEEPSTASRRNKGLYLTGSILSFAKEKLSEFIARLRNQLNSGGTISKNEFLNYLNRSQVPPTVEKKFFPSFVEQLGDQITREDIEKIRDFYAKWLGSDISKYQNKFKPFPYEFKANAGEQCNTGHTTGQYGKLTVRLYLNDGPVLQALGMTVDEMTSLYNYFNLHVKDRPACIGWLTVEQYYDREKDERVWMVWEFQSDACQQTSNIKNLVSQNPEKKEKLQRLRNILEQHICKSWRYMLMNKVLKLAKAHNIKKILMPTYVNGNKGTTPNWAKGMKLIYDRTAKEYGGNFDEREITPGFAYAFAPFGFYVIDVENFDQSKFARKQFLNMLRYGECSECQEKSTLSLRKNSVNYLER